MKKKRMKGRYDRTLMGCVLLFQITAMLILSVRGDVFDRQALYLAGIMPLVTAAVLTGLPRIWRIDRTILTLVMFLCSVSIVVLTAIARNPITPLTQAIYIGGGIVVMIMAIAFIRWVKKWKKWNWFLILVSFGLLIAPIVIGTEVNGARNWIVFKKGGVTLFSIQPSEFVKVSLVFVLASMMSGKKNLKETYGSVVIAAVLCVILLVQKDLGALLLYFLTTVILFFLSTTNWALSILGLAAGGGGGYVAYHLFDHVKTRFDIWKNPWLDPQVDGYQIIQALVAIGSGGWFGMGIGAGFPRDIPLYSSDFIYAAICEQFGLIFALLLLAVYAIIVLRGISIAMSARNSFHALLSFGVVTLLGLQTLLIVGGNTRLIPLTGVVLPFIAEGGSSLVSYMAMIGMLLGISSINADLDVEDQARGELLYGRRV